MTSRPLIKQSLLLLNVNGLNPAKTDTWSNLNAFVSILLSTAMTTECLMGIFLKWKSLDSLEAIVLFIACYHAVAKMLILVVYRKNMEKILNNIDQLFWPPGECGEEFQNHVRFIHTFIKNIIRIILVLFLILATFYLCIPFIFNIRKLPFDTYHPSDTNQSPDYEIAYLVQTCIFLKCLPTTVFGYDFLFVSLITHIVSELRMISKKLTTINSDLCSDEASILEELKEIGKHHTIVLRCIHYMKESYSILLINQFMTVLFIIFLGLLAIIVGGWHLDLHNLASAITAVLIFSSLLFLYCAGGSFLTFESQNVAIAAFQTNWWVKTQPKVRRSTALIILRSQKSETLTAGGMVKLNLETFASVVRTALSFFMVMQTLFHKVERNI